VKDRINAVNAKLLSAKGIRSLFIANSCKNMLKSISRQTYKEGSQAVPDKTSGLDHMNDALGYLVEFLFPVRRDFTPSPPQRFS
jgi:hypothetical protein